MMPRLSLAWAAVSCDPAMGRILAHRSRVLHQPLLQPATGLSAPQQLEPARGFSKLAIIQPSFEPSRSLLPSDQVGIVRARSFSTKPQSGVILPPTPWVILPPTPRVILPLEPRLIRPKLGPVRGLTTGPMGYTPLPQPIITQMSCQDPNDSSLSYKLDLKTYFSKYRALEDAKWRAKFFRTLDQKNLMMAVWARNFWASAADLVAINRRRGRCVAKYLAFDNVVAFPAYGTLGLKVVGADDIVGMDPTCFQGYIALKKLFLDVMSHLYGPGVMEEVSDDVSMWTTALDRAAIGYVQELMALQHAALLGRIGRAWLSVKVATLLRCVLYGVPYFDSFIEDVYLQLNTLGAGFSTRHPFFHEWRSHGERFGEKRAPILEDEDHLQWLREQVAKENGYWLCGINRHGILHTFSAALSRLSGVGRNYSTHDIIDLLHYKSSAYLPAVQNLFAASQNWGHLDMESCWPKGGMVWWIVPKVQPQK